MQPVNFEEVLDKIEAQDPRYGREAYVLLRGALDHVRKSSGKARKSEACHITGQDLLGGIRAYALELYGPMTKTLLNEWGIQRCEDFGEIVFNLVDHGLLSKTEKDSREDFKGGYDFNEAFCKPFLPPSKVTATLEPAKSAETKMDDPRQ
jgi:uncharacterized repeat protein (TIGR04138 family)